MHLCIIIIIICSHLYIIMCSAEPEVAVLDCTALKQIQYKYIGNGEGGVARLQVACEAHIHGGRGGEEGGEVLGHPTRFFLGFRPSYTDHFSIIIFSVGSHCQGIVTSYLPSTPISLSCPCNFS